MPIYSYLCNTCAHEFELKQAFDAEPAAKCPQCRGSARRQFHPVGVIYKGSGFYTTDYRRPSNSSSSDDKEASGSSADDKGTSGSSADDKGTSGSSADDGGSH